jgi:hypothetical protein
LRQLFQAAPGSPSGALWALSGGAAGRFLVLFATERQKLPRRRQ